MFVATFRRPRGFAVARSLSHEQMAVCAAHGERAATRRDVARAFPGRRVGVVEASDPNPIPDVDRDRRFLAATELDPDWLRENPPELAYRGVSRRARAPRKGRKLTKAM
jgi:hypothetical protein